MSRTKRGEQYVSSIQTTSDQADGPQRRCLCRFDMPEARQIARRLSHKRADRATASPALLRALRMIELVDALALKTQRHMQETDIRHGMRSADRPSDRRNAARGYY